MKKNNEGTSKLQVLTAFFVMAVVALGCAYAIRYVTSQYGSDGSAAQSKANAENKAANVALKVEMLARDADIDFDFDFATGSCVSVSQRGYTVLTIADKKLYIYEESFEDLTMDDEAKIAMANQKKGMKAGSLFCEDVNFFGIDMDGKKDGKAIVTVRVQVNKKESDLQKEFALNEYTVMRANGQEIERTDMFTDASKQDNVENNSEKDPVLTQQEIQPEPQPKDEKIEKQPETKVDETGSEKADEQNVPEQKDEPKDEPKIEKQDNPTGLYVNGALDLATLKKSTADAEIVVTLLCEEQKAKAGWCVGGIGIGGTEVSDNEALQYKISGAPTVGKVYTARFAVCDILAQAKAEGTDAINVIFYNGFTVQNVEIDMQ